MLAKQNISAVMPANLMRLCVVKLKEQTLTNCKFHMWGMEALEGRSDEYNIMWTVGIVENSDGEVLCVSPECIKFTDLSNEVLSAKKIN